MIFLSYLVAGIFSFFCFWLSTVIFDSKLENKVLRSAILAALTFAVSLIFSQLGIIGIIISFIISFILLMKILGYNFFSALLFIIGLNLLSGAIFFGLANIFPNTPKALSEKNTVINSMIPDTSVANNSSIDNLAEKSPSSNSKYVVSSVGTTISTSNKPLTNPINDRHIPRIMMWGGKVNQHWDLETGLWLTDLDGRSGAQLDKLTYCKKFYPNTISIVEYKNETINTWKAGGNNGDYTGNIMSYRCVLSGESI